MLLCFQFPFPWRLTVAAYTYTFSSDNNYAAFIDERDIYIYIAHAFHNNCLILVSINSSCLVKYVLTKNW